jgi:hypothetical protein
MGSKEDVGRQFEAQTRLYEAAATRNFHKRARKGRRDEIFLMKRARHRAGTRPEPYCGLITAAADSGDTDLLSGQEGKSRQV